MLAFPTIAIRRICTHFTSKQPFDGLVNEVKTGRKFNCRIFPAWQKSLCPSRLERS
jgi:hypothetical protein